MKLPYRVLEQARIATLIVQLAALNFVQVLDRNDGEFGLVASQFPGPKQQFIVAYKVESIGLTSRLDGGTSYNVMHVASMPQYERMCNRRAALFCEKIMFFG